jgi:hypothetical protein
MQRPAARLATVHVPSFGLLDGVRCFAGAYPCQLWPPIFQQRCALPHASFFAVGQLGHEERLLCIAGSQYRLPHHVDMTSMYAPGTCGRGLLSPHVPVGGHFEM